jgi:hypothetical protein
MLGMASTLGTASHFYHKHVELEGTHENHLRNLKLSFRYISDVLCRMYS